MKLIVRHLNRPILIAAATACALLAPVAHAEARDRSASRYTTYGKVIHVEPIYRKVIVRTPTEQCRIKDERYVVQEGYSNYREGYSHYQENSNRNSRNHRHSNRSGNTVAGGIIGGVIGNQLARNSSSGARAGATIAGAIIGSVIADDVHGGQRHYRKPRPYNRRYSNNHTYHEPYRGTTYGTRPVKHCQTIIKTSVDKRLDGYHVTYLHRGRRLSTRTRKKPGARIPLNATLSPARW